MSDTKARINEILERRGLDVTEVGNIDDPKVGEPSPRFTKLNELYFTVKNTIDMEYPYWYNRAWQANDGDLPDLRRAKSVGSALRHMTPTIWPGELLVMNKTKNWRGAFPFPWIDCSFFNAQAEALMAQVDEPIEETTADKMSVVAAGGGNVTESYGNIVSIGKKFGLRKEEVPVLVKISHLWEHASAHMASDRYGDRVKGINEWRGYLDAVLIMFDSWALPQGREVMNYYLPLEYGFDKLDEMCEEKIEELIGEAGDDGILGMNRGYYYMATQEIVRSLSVWADNYARRARQLAGIEQDPQQKADYEKIAEVMHNVAHKQPGNFREALQMVLLCHLGVVNEDPISGMSIGRLGQVLQPFYAKDIEEGVTTDEEVIELLELFRIKITSIECFASAGVTGGVLSGNTFNNLSIGGLGKDGQSAATPLEYLIIEAAMRAKTTQPTLSLLYDEKLPEPFMVKVAQCIKTGIGFPAIMNFECGSKWHIRQFGDEGMNYDNDAFAWAIGGCLEGCPGAFQPLHYKGTTTWIPGGASPTAGTGIHFIGLPKLLELVLNNGMDMRSGKRVFPEHNHPLDTFEDLMYVIEEVYLPRIWDLGNRVNNIQMDIWRKDCPPVVNSLMKYNCFEKGQGIANLGARYNGSINNETCGTVNFINSLASIRKNVYEDGKYTIEQMTDAINHNFGYKTAFETGVYSPDAKVVGPDAAKYEQIYTDCILAPKYGNDIPEVDSLLHDWEYFFVGHLKTMRTYMGKKYYFSQMSATTHGPMGAVCLAGPDGRLAGTTLADGSMSPVAQTDKNGIYALFQSATVFDHSISQNTQMNIKIHPSAVKGGNGTKKLLDVIRAYMRKGGYHIQFNVTSSKVMREAQRKPDEYAHLMVRVAGFTQYWCELGKPIQDEVIYRTEYDE